MGFMKCILPALLFWGTAVSAQAPGESATGIIIEPGFLRKKNTTENIAAVADTNITNFSKHKRSLTFSGLLQTRYVVSLTKNVDINGRHFDNTTEKPITNTFLVRRARLGIRATVNDHFSANFMINFAEFNTSPANRVLENAFVRYTLNRHFSVQAGQFRPFFGIEDAVPVDIIRTLDYSNQYYSFGNNGWQSFQIGLTVLGDITKEEENPLKYYVGVYNGNNRNQSTDNDDTKNLYLRLSKKVVGDVTIGINAATGSMATSTGNAWGADFYKQVNLSTKWKLLFGGEYKSGSNFSAYSASAIPNRQLKDYRMHGFYFFPILRFDYTTPRVRAIEFSARYEYFDESYKQNSNPRQTIIPNLSFIFADDFFAAIQVGTSIDLYKRQIPLTTSYNHNLLYMQLQCRF